LIFWAVIVSIESPEGAKRSAATGHAGGNQAELMDDYTAEVQFKGNAAAA
jgi:hypothetical protein